jgi:iron-sulfur cluster assembly accessory protein
MIHTISITKSAWIKIGGILDKTNKYSFLFSIAGGGCNVYNYIFKTIDSTEFYSIVNGATMKPRIIENNHHKVLIDPLSESLLTGTMIDFEKNLYESKFKFIPNQNKSHSCGCGISFSPNKHIW